MKRTIILGMTLSFVLFINLVGCSTSFNKSDNRNTAENTEFEDEWDDVEESEYEDEWDDTEDESFIVADNNYYTFTVTSIEQDSSGTTINYDIYNNSGYEFGFYISSLVLNDRLTVPYTPTNEEYVFIMPDTSYIDSIYIDSKYLDVDNTISIIGRYKLRGWSSGEEDVLAQFDF